MRGAIQEAALTSLGKRSFRPAARGGIGRGRSEGTEGLHLTADGSWLIDEGQKTEPVGWGDSHGV